MPTCQQIMSVTVSGPFTSGPISSPSSTSSHQRGSAPRGASRAYCSSIAASSSSVYGACSSASSFLRSRAFVRSVRTMLPVLTRQQRAVVGAEHLGGPLVDGALGELATACRARRPARCAATCACRRAAAPTTRGRSRRRTRGRRAAGRPSSGRGARRATSVTSSSPISVSPPTMRRRRDRRPPAVVARVRGIAPQRVVVAVGLGDVTERVGVGTQVVRRARVRLGHADARAQPRDALVGDASRWGSRRGRYPRPVPERRFSPATRSMPPQTPRSIAPGRRKGYGRRRTWRCHERSMRRARWSSDHMRAVAPVVAADLVDARGRCRAARWRSRRGRGPIGRGPPCAGCPATSSAAGRWRVVRIEDVVEHEPPHERVGTMPGSDAMKSSVSRRSGRSASRSNGVVTSR